MEVNDIVLFDFDAFISGSKDIDYQQAIKNVFVFDEIFNRK
jgi:hypothetical protein